MYGYITASTVIKAIIIITTVIIFTTSFRLDVKSHLITPESYPFPVMNVDIVHFKVIHRKRSEVNEIGVTIAAGKLKFLFLFIYYSFIVGNIFSIYKIPKRYIILGLKWQRHRQ